MALHSKSKKDFTSPHYRQGVLALQAGRSLEALKHAFLAYETTPQHHNSRLLLAHTLKNASFNQFNPQLKRTLLKLLSAPKLDHQNLSKAWLSLLLIDPAMSEFSNLYHGRPYDLKKLQICLGDSYLLAGLEKFIVFDMPFEIALKAIYRHISAEQLFCRPFEKVLSVYHHHTEGLICEDMPPPKIEINDNIPTLSAPQNDIHSNVQRQYEYNPYPRWLTCDVQEPSKEPMLSTHQHLIAGCGTGYGTCLTALRYPNAQITAIDLSLASLSYAVKKTKELGIKNVQFFQADILNLQDLNKTFDIIECSGVLHHMSDPLAGWRALLQKLKPEGKMHIGLYSELGRADVVAARKIISEQSFIATPEGIKEARGYIAKLPEGRPAKGVMTRRDFYSLSGCRDLIFHVQEERYTIEAIQDSLNKLNLRFHGFELDNPATAQTYKTTYPDDPAMVDLQNWTAFEEESPSTFRGMYQFWCSPK